jgi:CubicO group peptidase (beta-lactamase class C family)
VLVLASASAALAANPVAGVAHPAGWVSETGLDRFVRQQRAEFALSGMSVVVIEKGAVAFEHSYGDAAPDGPAVTSSTPFVLGSTSKQFTGLAIQQLVARGALTLDDSVGMLLADLGGANSRFATVTVSQLLTHKSGISYVTGNEEWDPLATVTSVQGEARLILQSAPSSSPGKQYEYSNGNYTLLGAIIENLTGESYPEALQTLVTRPLGLGSTTADLAAARANGLATGHYRWFGAVDSTTPGQGWPMAAPSAYVTSTASDLTTLLRAQLGRPSGIDASVLAADRVPLSRLNKYSQYGSGWFIRPFWELHDADKNWNDPTLPKLWEHDGDAERSMSYLAFAPDIGFGVVVLTNSGMGTDRDRWSRFTYSLLHEIVGTKSSPSPVDPVTAAAPFVLVALPVLLLLTIGWLVLGLVRRPRSRLARAAPLVVGVLLATAVGVIGFVFVPSKTFIPLFDGGWWTSAPDFSISVGASMLLALVILAVVVVSVTRVVRHRARKVT